MKLSFRPSLVPTLTFLILLPLMMWMGFWQLDRAEQKRTLQAEYDARVDAEPVSLGAERWHPDDARFRRLTLKGYYETDYQILVDNRVHQGVVGYYVITPLRVGDSSLRVLINRGWIPLGQDRQHLPVIETPKDMQTITGVAMVPGDRYFTLGETHPAPGTWQTVWQNMDLGEYAKAVPFKVQPVVVLLDGNSQAGGYVREWTRLDAGIATHQSYAMQWFSLSIALVAIYLLVNTRRIRDSSDRQGDNNHE